MFEKDSPPFFHPNLRHLCLKNSILDKYFLFHQMNLKFQVAFPYFIAIFPPICSRKHHFCVSKHFHGRGLNFQQMNV